MDNGERERECLQIACYLHKQICSYFYSHMHEYFTVLRWMIHASLYKPQTLACLQTHSLENIGAQKFFKENKREMKMRKRSNISASYTAVVIMCDVC